MKMKPDPGNRLHEFPEKIHHAGHHLLNLVNDVLDIAQVEQGKMSIQLLDCSLDTIVNECIGLCEGHLGESDVTVTTENLDICVLADPLRLSQIITNLISNAIKYNNKDGSVIISVTNTSPDEVELSISDTGVGIPRKHYELLFEPFSRLDYAQQSMIQGSGIGLYLTKQLIEEMGGRIAFESTEGKGSRFFITLQRAKAKKNNHIKVENDTNNVFDKKKRTIVYIEDDPDSQELMKLICKQLPQTTLLTSSTAEGGLKLIKEHNPDLVFLDINLPDIDGFTALKKIKDMPESKQPTVIGLSSDAMIDQVNRAMEAGFDHYITKPVDVDKTLTFITCSSLNPI